MAVELIDIIKPKNGGSFPLVEDVDFKGGFRAVTDTTARDNIPAAHRTIGMLVWTDASSQLWQLRGGLLNTNWVIAELAAMDLTQVNTDLEWLAGVVANIRQQPSSDPSIPATDMTFTSQAPNAGGGLLTGRPGNMNFAIPASVGGADNGSFYFFSGGTNPVRIDTDKMVITNKVEFGTGLGSGPRIGFGTSTSVETSPTEGSLMLISDSTKPAGFYSYHNGQWVLPGTGLPTSGDIFGSLPNPALRSIQGTRLPSTSIGNISQNLTLSRNGSTNCIVWDPTIWNADHSFDGPTIWTLNPLNSTVVGYSQSSGNYISTGLIGGANNFTDMCIGQPLKGGVIGSFGNPVTLWVANQTGTDYTTNPILLKIDTTPTLSDSTTGRQSINGVIAVIPLTGFPTNQQVSVVYDTDNNYVYAASAGSGTVYQIDPNTFAITNIPTGSTQNSITSLFYANGVVVAGSNATESTLFVINSSNTPTVAGTIVVGSGGAPAAMAYDPNGGNFWGVVDRFGTAGSSLVFYFNPNNLPGYTTFDTGYSYATNLVYDSLLGSIRVLTGTGPFTTVRIDNIATSPTLGPTGYISASAAINNPIKIAFSTYGFGGSGGLLIMDQVSDTTQLFNDVSGNVGGISQTGSSLNWVTPAQIVPTPNNPNDDGKLLVAQAGAYVLRQATVNTPIQMLRRAAAGPSGQATVTGKNVGVQGSIFRQLISGPPFGTVIVDFDLGENYVFILTNTVANQLLNIQSVDSVSGSYWSTISVGVHVGAQGLNYIKFNDGTAHLFITGTFGMVSYQISGNSPISQSWGLGATSKVYPVAGAAYVCGQIEGPTNQVGIYRLSSTSGLPSSSLVVQVAWPATAGNLIFVGNNDSVANNSAGMVWFDTYGPTGTFLGLGYWNPLYNQQGYINIPGYSGSVNIADGTIISLTGDGNYVYLVVDTLIFVIDPDQLTVVMSYNLPDAGSSNTFSSAVWDGKYLYLTTLKDSNYLQFDPYSSGGGSKGVLTNAGLLPTSMLGIKRLPGPIGASSSSFIMLGNTTTGLFKVQTPTALEVTSLATGGFFRRVTTLAASSTYHAQPNDNLIVVGTGTNSVYLPDPGLVTASAGDHIFGMEITVKNTLGTVTVYGSAFGSSPSIEGSTSYTLTGAYTCATFTYGGNSTWLITSVITGGGG